jgi:mRNA interferase RelE/StbE
MKNSEILNRLFSSKLKIKLLDGVLNAPKGRFFIREPGKYWKYRDSDYRIICQIREKEITVLVVRVGHRKEIYR